MDAEADGFTILGSSPQDNMFGEYARMTAAKTADVDVQLQGWLRNNHPDLNLTVVPASNCPLLPFAYAGNATATLESSKDEPVIRWRGYAQPSKRGGQGVLGDVTFFAKYHYAWAGEDFIVYTVGSGPQCVQYVLKEPDTSKGEDAFSHCKIVDKLIVAAVEFSEGDQNKYIYVYDRYWARSRSLWESVQKAEWENVILNPKQKKALRSVSKAFFDSKETYERYGVPWKRGLIFYGPPGNGKTISIKALMHELYDREHPIPTLYVKSAPQTYDIRAVFTLARQFSPCLLVMEDVETIVTSATRSYFFNEVDGLENNDGIMMVASTNYIDRLDPGLSRRPSRFDRKYLFPLPDMDQRVLYAEYWRGKLARSNPKIQFPETLCRPFAVITSKFSFAYMQEAFVAALLELARHEVGVASGEIYEDLRDDSLQVFVHDRVPFSKEYVGRRHNLDQYPLWIALKKSVALLREDLDEGGGEEAQDANEGKQKEMDQTLEAETHLETWEEGEDYRRIPIRCQAPPPDRLNDRLNSWNDQGASRLVGRPSLPLRSTVDATDETFPHLHHELTPSPFSRPDVPAPTPSNVSFKKPKGKTARRVTEQELYAAGVAKYPYIAETAYDHKKCPW